MQITYSLWQFSNIQNNQYTVQQDFSHPMDSSDKEINNYHLAARACDS